MSDVELHALVLQSCIAIRGRHVQPLGDLVGLGAGATRQQDGKLAVIQPRQQVDLAKCQLRKRGDRVERGACRFLSIRLTQCRVIRHAKLNHRQGDTETLAFRQPPARRFDECRPICERFEQCACLFDGCCESGLAASGRQLLPSCQYPQLRPVSLDL